ncbi:N-alpha-acetyltransferase 38, NatC auxiliary subunit-like [Hydractinia symbiolongicarpus]|uniref:N-alpha-acetyltransferase 38, NatC auxiliary subunit-like n=1 Tax=Hydractinia symbiolongicarpus TaxID=13093 RepID=UPI002551850C|nr:N-alpha-acetyltransferase 38, NatC auxiliary subunit-like [Hydractinia symbiolongicarpus]XP_057317252.1 N-alpha-acetyltransferase 38, NatC auxiliary subunit-like [Hydractinia symbiolongicarpus]
MEPSILQNNEDVGKPLELPVSGKATTGRMYLELLLNKSMKVEISDGRTLIGQFLCTDADENIILGSCQEFIGNPSDENAEEPRLLGLAMIPGRHVKTMHVDMDKKTQEDIDFVTKKEERSGESQ